VLLFSTISKTFRSINCNVRFTDGLSYFRKSLHIREFYPEKNGHESKIKRDYGNKAYQDEKDLDALYLYTQVDYLTDKKLS